MDKNHPSFSTDSADVACIIVAGGTGTRCGLDKPKQFCALGTEPVLAHAVRFFATQPRVGQVIVVAPPDLISETEAILRELNLAVPWVVTAGGARRQDSVLAGLRAVAGSSIALIHDGARPFPPHNLDDALQVLQDGFREGNFPTGVVFALPATDSIKRVHGKTIVETVPRAELWAMQTPQMFPTTTLIEALHQCDQEGAEVTDDASAFEHMGWQVRVVPGSRNNIKITYAEDFIMAEAILQARHSTLRKDDQI